MLIKYYVSSYPNPIYSWLFDFTLIISIDFRVILLKYWSQLFDALKLTTWICISLFKYWFLTINP